MQKVTVGLIPAPESPSILVAKIRDRLCELFRDQIDSTVEWNIEVQVDPLTGAAEYVEDIIDEATILKEKYDWDFSICITDLPIFSEGKLVLGDSNGQEGVAQISLPAFGLFPTKKRLIKIMIHMVSELYYAFLNQKGTIWATKGIGPLVGNKKKNVFSSFKKMFYFSPIRRITPPTDIEKINSRFVIVPKINAQFRVLLGMTLANRPWTIMPSFKRVVAISFATGAYGLIFNTLWKLSISYDVNRFLGLMVGAIFGMVIWIIFAHYLWEPKTNKNTEKVRNLYNYTTILTLVVTVSMFYIILFLLFQIAVVFFVPPDLFKETTGLTHDITPLNYMKLAWLVTSIATVAGAIGAGLEDDSKVRNVTYGYRQHRRYAEMKKQKEKEEEKEATEAKEDK